MKKLILIVLVAIGIEAKSQGNQWLSSEVQDNRYGVLFFPSSLNGEYHVHEWKDTTFQNWICDSIKWYNYDTLSATLTPTDINSLKESKNKVGFVELYAGSVAPTGWLLCDGSAVSRTTYSVLFALIGTMYGAGDGTTTFNLPNLSGTINYIIKY